MGIVLPVCCIPPDEWYQPPDAIVPLIQRRAAIAVALPPGIQVATNVHPPGRETIRTVWSPQLVDAAKIATAGLFGAAGSAAATRATASQVGGETPHKPSRTQVKTRASMFSGSGSQPGRGSEIDSENDIFGEREHDYEADCSSPTRSTTKKNAGGEIKGNDKGNRKGKEKIKAKGKNRGKQAVADQNAMASPTGSGTEVAGLFLRDTSNSKEGDNGSARTRRMSLKRRPRPSSASDGFAGTPIKRSRVANWSNTEKASGQAIGAPSTIPVEKKTMSAGSSFLCVPSMSSSFLEPSTSFDPTSVSDQFYVKLESCMRL